MTTVALDADDPVTVPGTKRNSTDSLANALTGARKEVLGADHNGSDEVVGATLHALERHIPCVSLPDVLELRVLIDTDATDPESAFVDTTEQALDHLTSWH